MASGDPGIRTAPAFTAAASDRLIGLGLIDASGDVYTESLHVPVAATAGNIETWAAAYAAASQASLYSITDTIMRVGDADPDNANTDQRNSVKDGINLLFKNLTTHLTEPERLIAPILATMQGNQDIPLLSSTEAAALITATLTLLTGFTFQRGQFTERRERKNNPVVK